MVWCLLECSQEAPVFTRSPCKLSGGRVWRRGAGGGSGAASSQNDSSVHEHAKVEGLFLLPCVVHPLAKALASEEKCSA